MSAKVTSQRAGSPISSGLIALVALLAAITMLFASFSSAYIERVSETRAVHSALPPALWASTALLLAASWAVERARASARRQSWEKTRLALRWTLALGLLFVGSQLLAWRQLAGQGVGLASTEHSSFFYLLTLMHALHVLGGLAWLVLALVRVRGLRPELRTVTPKGAKGRSASGRTGDPSPAERGAETVALCATYWHFLDGLWLYLFALLYVL